MAKRIQGSTSMGFASEPLSRNVADLELLGLRREGFALTTRELFFAENYPRDVPDCEDSAKAKPPGKS